MVVEQLRVASQTEEYERLDFTDKASWFSRKGLDELRRTYRIDPENIEFDKKYVAFCHQIVETAVCTNTLLAVFHRMVIYNPEKELHCEDIDLENCFLSNTSL